MGILLNFGPVGTLDQLGSPANHGHTTAPELEHTLIINVPELIISDHLLEGQLPIIVSRSVSRSVDGVTPGRLNVVNGDGPAISRGRITGGRLPELKPELKKPSPFYNFRPRF